MTLQEASQIVVMWGKYVEYIFGKLMVVFSARIPESLLPFPKKTLNEALDILAEHHRCMGNKNGVETIKAVAGYLDAYVNDEEALLQAAKNFSDPEWRKAFIPSLQKLQETWIKNKKFEG
jgi:hypothetical protein